MALFPVFLLWPAGTWRSWEAWALVAVYLLWAGGTWVWLSRANPELLAERLQGSPVQEQQFGWDRVVMVLMMLSGLALLVVPGLDVVRFGWSEPLPPWLELTALALHVPAMLMMVWVMHTNTFLARVVKIDEARDHRTLPGYPEYAQKTRFRLIPGVW